MTTVFASNNTPRTKEAFRLRRDFMELNKIPTNIIFERDKYLFETPDFLPLIPKRSMMSTISEGTSVLNTTKESYNNFVEYVSTKTLQNKMNITFIDINKKVSFETSDPLEKYREKNIRHYNAFIRYLDRNKNIIINTAQYYYNTINELKRNLLTQCCVNTPSVFYSKKLQELNLLKTEPKTYSGAADYDLYCNIVDNNVFIERTQDWLGYYYRWHPDQATWQMRKDNINYDLLIQNKWREKWT